MSEEEKRTLKELQRKAEQEEKDKKKIKRGLTDKVSIAVAVLTVAAFIFSALLMWKTNDTSALPQFIISAAGFGTIVLSAAIAKNTYEKKIQFGSEEIHLNENRYDEAGINGN